MKHQYHKHFLNLDQRNADKREYIAYLIDLNYSPEEADTLYMDWMGLS